jgi:hypothetical protein
MKLKFKTISYCHGFGKTVFKRFSSGNSITDKEKRLQQFFKLPKHKLEFHDKIYDRNPEEMSVLGSYEEQQIDKLDLMNKVMRQKRVEAESKMSKFFQNNTPRENIKISENLIEKLRLKKEFKFTENFKQK